MLQELLEESYKNGIIFRSLGPQNSKEILGGGFLEKGVNFKANYNHINFKSPKYSLVYVIKGKGEYITKDKKIEPLKKGSVFIRYPNSIHTQTIDIKYPWSEFFIDFGPSVADSFKMIGLIDPYNPVLHSYYDETLILRARDLIKQLKECSQPKVLSLYPEFIRLHHDVIDRCKNKDVNKENSLDNICNLLTTNLNHRLDIRKFCTEHQLQYENFRKVFTNRMGISPLQYIIRARLDKAQHLLLSQKQLSVDSISLQLGYNNANEFSSQFKKNFKISPLQYRKQN
jgi:AraC-like DNA-binding protein